MVCDQLGFEGLKLINATIKKMALKQMASKMTSSSRLPLLSFFNRTCLSSVYSWLITVSLLTDDVTHAETNSLEFAMMISTY